MFTRHQLRLGTLLTMGILGNFVPHLLLAVDEAKPPPLTQEQYELESSRMSEQKKLLGDESNALMSRAREVRTQLWAIELAAFRERRQKTANTTKIQELEKQAVAQLAEFVSADNAYREKVKEKAALEKQLATLHQSWQAQQPPKPRLNTEGLAALKKEVSDLKGKLEQFAAELATARAAKNDALVKQRETELNECVQAITAADRRLKLYSKDLAKQEYQDQRQAELDNARWMKNVDQFTIALIHDVPATITPAQLAAMRALAGKYEAESRIAASKGEPKFVAVARLQNRLDEELARILTMPERNELLDRRLFRFHPGMMLEPAVQLRLNITPEQIKQITKLCETWPISVKEVKHAQAFHAILTPEQKRYFERLDEREGARTKLETDKFNLEQVAARTPQWRVWKSAAGTAIEAELAGYRDDTVTLKEKGTGREIKVPRLKLSLKDRAYLHERYVRSSLQKDVRIAFVDASLSDVLDYFNVYIGGYLVYDIASLRASGVSVDRKITINRETESFIHGFETVLRQLGLKFTPSEGRIYIEPRK